MNAAPLPSNHENAADDLLAVMLMSEAGRNRVLYELNVSPVHMPTLKHRRLFEAIRDCVKAGEPIHDTTVREKCGSIVTVDWYAQIADLYDSTRGAAVLTANAAIVRRHGLNAIARNELREAESVIAKGQTYSDVLPGLMTKLASIETNSSIEGETADLMADSFADFMDSPPPALMLTGIPWLDQLSGGFDRGHIWWIAAPYKSRKSTVMLNIALGMLMTWYTRGCAGEPPSIGIASGEMPQKRVIAQIVAMLGVANIRRRNLWRETFTAGTTAYPLHMISARALMNARAAYRQWDPRRVEAIDYGIRQYANFGRALRVYDRSKEGGGLSDLNSLFTIMRRDMHLYRTNVFFIDYLQLFQPAEAKLFEYMSWAARELQKFAAHEGVTLVALAQQNEDTIKTGTTYSAGIKGGGDAASTADYLLTSLYKAGDFADDATKLQLTMKLSRHGDGGGDTKRVHDIHPHSGLLMEADWIGRL
jgi:hypothetical protein